VNRFHLKATLIILIATSVLSAKENTLTSQIPEIRPGILQGYLDPKVLPNSLKLIPEAPVPGSARQKLDNAVSQDSFALQGTPRWEMAARDADLSFPNAAKIFSCALGVPITEKQTPHLYLLLRRTVADAGLSTYTAKNHYQRVRPFMLNRKPICTPEEREDLKKDGSHPSGHTAIGWAWALILAEIAPDHADTILARGRAFGESRVVCNVHWHSDVVEGRFVGASAVAKLHADPQFNSELKAAKKELSALYEKGIKSTNDCKFERDALTHTEEK
jgi:acid phosphatase (class A)